MKTTFALLTTLLFAPLAIEIARNWKPGSLETESQNAKSKNGSSK